VIDLDSMVRIKCHKKFIKYHLKDIKRLQKDLNKNAGSISNQRNNKDV